MWRVLRITLLAAAWELRCTRDQAGVQFDAAAVARACAEAVRRLVHADWARVGNRDLPAAAGVCPSWFPRSRQVHMEWEDFQLAWCVGGIGIGMFTEGHLSSRKACARAVRLLGRAPR
jgi:hypothetical protein